MEEVKKNVEDYFDQESREYESEYFKNTPEGYSFRVRKTRVLELAPKADDGVALDVGCGPGIIFEDLIGLGYKKVFGLDVSEDMVRIANDNFRDNENIVIKTGDVENLEFGDYTAPKIFYLNDKILKNG
mgnify:CR=1 FL=1